MHRHVACSRTHDGSSSLPLAEKLGDDAKLPLCYTPDPGPMVFDMFENMTLRVAADADIRARRVERGGIERGAARAARGGGRSRAAGREGMRRREKREQQRRAGQH